MSARDEGLTAREAEIRLGMYQESRFTVATYGSGAERALHEIATALLAQVRELRANRAEVLCKAADWFEAECPSAGGSMDLCMCHAAEPLRRMADEAGKDTRKGESTRAASPWQQAVDGLNALVDAGIPVHVEPDGHIANTLGDEHIEWDRAAGRWRLVHDGEDAPETPACARCRQPFDPSDTRFDGRARHHGGPFCRRCVGACRYATDPFHRCVVCHAPEGGDADA
ncbi:hypothetical protein [Streptomyces chrestomyceticus]|uniref:hypothetical protein n=1 Tax=Streptomyces chrestomyceticus TaxID=68185 RepID=UPI0034028A9F